MAFAIVFDGVGAGEWLVLLAVLLVVMGPKRLPSVIRSFGNHYAKFRRAAESFKRQIMEMDTEFERAVDSAAREAEEAAKIPDIVENPVDSSYGSDGPYGPDGPDGPYGSDDPYGPDYSDPPERSVDQEPQAAPAEVAEQAATDGDRASQES